MISEPNHKIEMIKNILLIRINLDGINTLYTQNGTINLEKLYTPDTNQTEVGSNSKDKRNTTT